MKHPQILGGNIAGTWKSRIESKRVSESRLGTVVTTGTNVLRLKEGDEVLESSLMNIDV